MWAAVVLSNPWKVLSTDTVTLGCCSTLCWGKQVTGTKMGGEGSPARKPCPVSVLRGTVDGEDLWASIGGHSPGWAALCPRAKRARQVSGAASLTSIGQVQPSPAGLPLGDPQFSPLMSLWCPLFLTTTLQAVLGASQCALWELTTPPFTSQRAFINCLYCSLLIGNN